MEDRFTARAIAPHLHTKRLGRSLLVLPSTDSTNTQVKQRFGKEPEGFVLLAEEQTAGRGRLGRSFVSPRGDGLYMSILLHPDLPLDKIPLLMLTSAVAVCEALEHQCGVWPKIKWVNDIFLRGRKCCGILTESSFSTGGSRPDFAVVGIGLNLRFNRAAYPELADIAGSLSDETHRLPTRAQLAASILNAFEPWYDKLLAGETCGLLDAYRSRMNCLRRRITVTSPAGQYPAFCVGLTDTGNLIIVDQNGTQSILRAGEISVRL